MRELTSSNSGHEAKDRGGGLSSDRGQPGTAATSKAALDLLLELGAVTELRALGTARRTVSGYFTNPDEMARAATAISGKAEGVYFTLNPVNPALLARADNRVKPYAKHTTNDADILRRRWLPLDFDPKRPAGVSSTDEEHRLALERAIKCREWLSHMGWPDPIMADSGNGGHLLYRIELLNDAASSNLIKRVLEAVALRFSDVTVEVDLKTYNAGRVWKVYGTLAAKGDNTGERPHRLAQILSRPATLQMVTLQQLSALAIPEAPLQSPRRNGQALDVAGWLAKHGIDFAQQKPWQGGTCYILRVCPNNPDHNRGEAYLVQFPSGAIAAGCLHTTCGLNWKSLRESYEPEIQRARSTAGDASEKKQIKAAEPQIDWRTLLICRQNKGGAPQPLPLLANAITAFRQAPEWKGVLGFNEFSLQVVTRRPTPWGKQVSSRWIDVDDSLATEWLQREGGIFVSSNTVAEAVQTVARENGFHPVRDYLKSLVWDEVPRIDTWLMDYLGCTDSQFIRTAGSRWLISAVARIFRPGCQADHVLLLEGPQGIRKSSALRALVGDEMFADHIADLGSKDSRLDLLGKWVIEMSELVSMRRGEIERVKAFLTARADHFRPPYGRRAVDVPRQNVFAASTNDGQPFGDATGNRRFWPVRCGDVDVASIERDRGQLWAEAYQRYRQGEAWWLDTPELNLLARQEQEERYEPGVWDDIILEWVEDPHQRADLSSGVTIPITPWYGSEPNKVTISDILIHAIGKDKDRLTQADRNQVARCLTHDGRLPKQDRGGSNRGKWFYVRSER